MTEGEQFTNESNLPGPVAGYLRAVNGGAKADFAASFADDAVVVEVNRELRGLDAITAWASADILGLWCTSTSWTSQCARDEPASGSRLTERSIERD
jgi:hypothetical protein